MVGLPTRSEVNNWTGAINDLSAAAEVYGSAASRIENASDAHLRQLSAPGGTDWDGDAADTAQQAAYSDRGVAYAAADLIRKMQKIANVGAGNIRQARDIALDAITEAERDDFRVDDDLSVTDTRRYTAQQMSAYEMRKAAAEAHHSYIAMRVRNLVSEDTKVGAELSAGAAELEGMIPADWNRRHPSIETVSDGEAQPYDNDGETADDDALSGEQIAERLRELRRGINRGIREIDTEDEIFDLYEELAKGGTQIPVPDNYYDRRVLPDGTIIGIRESNDHGPTLDVKYPPGVSGPDKVHLPPPVLPPATPPTPGEAPVIAAPPNLPVIDHPPVPSQMPPWAPTPSTGPVIPSLTPEEQVGIGGVLLGGLLGFLGWLGTPKVSF
ncbi:hypothetical protein ABQF34_17305 [Mycolicibacterium boenickei]